MIRCKECYSTNNRITPILNPLECLENHKQYICGTCGRCICIDKDEKRGVQRWNFPFKSLDIARFYLRTADFTCKKSCGIYEIINDKGRKAYKIFSSMDDLEIYLSKNKDKKCKFNEPIFESKKYLEYEDTEIRYLSEGEIQKYLSEKK